MRRRFTSSLSLSLSLPALSLLSLLSLSALSLLSLSSLSSLSPLSLARSLTPQVTIFKGWDQYRLFKAAHSVEQVEFDKGKVIINPGEINSKIYILLSGRIDVYATVGSGTPLNTLSKFDYFGETGFLSTCIHTKLSAGKYTESHCLVAQSRVQALVFPEEQFHVVDGNTALKMLDAYKVRNSWREQRVEDAKNERKVFRDVTRNLSKQVDRSHRKGPSSACPRTCD